MGVADGAGGRESRFDVWERREEPAFRLLPYAMLAISLVLCAITQHDSTKLLIDFALGAFAGLWMLVWVTLNPAWLRRPRPGAAFFVVIWAVMAAMVVNEPIFGFFTFTGYFHAWLALRGRWRFAGTAAIAVVTGTSQAGGLPSGSASSIAVYVVLLMINIGVSGGFTWFAFVGDQQDVRRRAMIDELTEVNQRLEESLRENAELHAQLVTQAREAGVLDERQRMAREIHDTLAQGLTGIITQLEAATTQRADRGAAGRHVEAAVRLARESLSEARRSVQALRPEPLEEARLPEALAEVTARWSALNGVEARVTTTGVARPLRIELEAGLLRTAQEALANVARHAHARRVGLTLSYMEDQVTLDVRDDGAGFEPTQAANGASGANGSPAGTPSGGFGLTAMRQRVQGLAGTLEIESEPGGGTAISASVPLIPAGGAS